MNNPQQATHTVTERDGDIIRVTDLARDERYDLDPVTAVVWQHCDGRTSPERLIALLQEQFSMPSDVAAELLWFTLDYLEKVDLLADPVIRERFVFSRRQVIKILAAAGITLAIAPSIVSNVSAAAGEKTTKSAAVFQPGTTTTTTTSTTTTSTTTTTTTTTTTATTPPLALTLDSIEAEPGEKAAAAAAAAAAAGLGLATWRKLTGKEASEQDEDAAQKGD